MTGSVHATENATVQQTLETGLESALEKAAQFGNAGIVLHKGNIIAQTQKGVLFKGSNEPTSPKNKWHIGSITKPMTATMIGRLAAKGTLDMQATIAELLPNELTNIDQSWHSVKLIDLLQHVSGAPANFDIDEMNERNFADQAALSNARHNAVMAVLAKPLAQQSARKVRIFQHRLHHRRYHRIQNYRCALRRSDAPRTAEPAWYDKRRFWCACSRQSARA